MSLVLGSLFGGERRANRKMAVRTMLDERRPKQPDRLDVLGHPSVERDERDDEIDLLPPYQLAQIARLRTCREICARGNPGAGDLVQYVRSSVLAQVPQLSNREHAVPELQIVRVCHRFVIRAPYNEDRNETKKGIDVE